MAGAQANIRNFHAPLKGPGRSAPTLLEDLQLFDPNRGYQSGQNLLQDGLQDYGQALYIAQLLPQGSCLHEYRLKKRQSSPPALDERAHSASVWRAAAVCRKCRVHLLLKVDYSVAWQEDPCPNWENPLHHLVRSEWRQQAEYKDLERDGKDTEVEIHVYECSSPKCSAIVTAVMSKARLSDRALYTLLDQDLLRQRTDAAFEKRKENTEGMKRPSPIDVLLDLRAYISNAWKKDARTQIELDNKRFIVRFGPEGYLCKRVLEYLGFELDQEKRVWQVPIPDLEEPLPLQSGHNVFLDDIENELDILIASRSPEERQAAQVQRVPEPALIELMRVLSCQNYDKHPSSRTITKSLLERSRTFATLGVPQDASDELVIWGYQRQMALVGDDSYQTAKLMTALEDVQNERHSEKLSSQVAIERSMGRYGEQTIIDSYRNLGITNEPKYLIDDVIIGNFEARLQDAPGQEPAMRESLAVIGDYRNSQRLIDFARNAVSTYEDALQFLGVEATTDDSFIAATYANKVSESSSSKEMAQKAFNVIAEHRNSNNMRAFAASGFQGEIQEAKMNVGEAYAAFGIDDRTIDDETLYATYEIRQEEGPQTRLRKALETIAEDKNSRFLKEKLQMPVDQQQTSTMSSLSEPIGLDNIGNTCYLNSLLQWLFTVVSVRQIVLDFDTYKRNGGIANMQGKRIGGRQIQEREVRTAQKFVAELSQLFRQMIASSDRAIRPTQELARLTLDTSGSGQGRRNSTMGAQRRSTLGAIDERPVFGPLPQAAFELETAQPLQSPEAMDTSDSAQGLSIGANKIPDPEKLPDDTKPNDPISDNASDTTLVSQNGTNNESSILDSVKQNEQQNIGTDLSPPGEQNHEDLSRKAEPLIQIGSQEKAQSRIVSPEPQPLDAIRDGMSVPSQTVSPESQEQADTKTTEQAPQQPQYAPPPGKPPQKKPPVPPRPVPQPPVTTQTLESWARQQDVTEVLEHLIFQLSCAIRPLGFDPMSNEQQDEVHDTFYGMERINIPGKPESEQMPVQFLLRYLQVNNDPKHLYAALDNYFDLEQIGSSDRYVTLTKLPPILCLVLGRNEYTATGSRKVNYHVDLPSTLFMDRYMDAPEDSPLVQRRRQTWNFKKELRQLQARMEQLEPKDKPPADETLATAVATLQHLADVAAAENLDGLTIPRESFTSLSEITESVRKERKDIRNRIVLLEQQIKDSFTDAAFRKHEYNLHAAFFHRGTVGSGHYWIYIYDHVGEIWRKYNDDHVTKVDDLREIFGNPADEGNPHHSTYSPPNPYFLVYVHTDSIRPGVENDIGIVETVKREPVIPPAPVINHSHPTNDHDSALGSDNSDSSWHNVDLHPIGTDTPASSHHEFAGQPSQMSHMPPASAPPQSYLDADAENPALTEDEFDEQTKWAMHQSLQGIEHNPDGSVKKTGDWDGVDNPNVPPGTW